MKHRELSKIQIAKIEAGRIGITEEKLIKVLNALAWLGNRDGLVRLGQDHIGAVAGGIGGPSVSHAVRYLQWADYIDVGQEEGDPHLAIFVRFKTWLGKGKKVTFHDHKVGQTIWGHPLKWWDPSCLKDPSVMSFFNALHDVKVSKYGAMIVSGLGQADIASRRGLFHTAGEMTMKAQDILNTWEYATMKRDVATPRYNLKRFRPGSPGVHPDQGGFYVADEPPASAPIPSPGYLGHVDTPDGVPDLTYKSVPFFKDADAGGSSAMEERDEDQNFRKVDEQDKGDRKIFVPYSSTGHAGDLIVAPKEGRIVGDPFFRHVDRDAPAGAKEDAGKWTVALTNYKAPVDATEGQDGAEDAAGHEDTVEGPGTPQGPRKLGQRVYHGSGQGPKLLIWATDTELVDFLVDMAQGKREGQPEYVVGLLNRLIARGLVTVTMEHGRLFMDQK